MAGEHAIATDLSWDHCLVHDYIYASARLHSVILAASRALAQTLARRRIACDRHLARPSRHQKGCLTSLLDQICLSPKAGNRLEAVDMCAATSGLSRCGWWKGSGIRISRRRSPARTCDIEAYLKLIYCPWRTSAAMWLRPAACGSLTGISRRGRCLNHTHRPCVTQKRPRLLQAL